MDDDHAPVVDAEVVPEKDTPDDDVGVPGPQGPVGTALATRPHVSNEVIRPLDRGEVVQAMRDHQLLLRDILDDSDWQGPPDKPGSFVKKSGWRKIALSYNLSVERVAEAVERGDDGQPLRATFVARATAPNGRAMEGTGHCSFSESRFSGPRGNKTKLENDMRATAETRAKNRAISDLIGMGKVSAEEADATGATAKYGPSATDDLRSRAERAVLFILAADPDTGPDDPRVKQKADSVIAGIIEADNGYLPAVVADAIRRVAYGLRELVEPAATTTKENGTDGSSDGNADADAGAGEGDGPGPGPAGDGQQQSALD